MDACFSFCTFKYCHHVQNAKCTFHDMEHETFLSSFIKQGKGHEYTFEKYCVFQIAITLVNTIRIQQVFYCKQNG